MARALEGRVQHLELRAVHHMRLNSNQITIFPKQIECLLSEPLQAAGDKDCFPSYILILMLYNYIMIVIE